MSLRTKRMPRNSVAQGPPSSLSFLSGLAAILAYYGELVKGKCGLISVLERLGTTYSGYF